MVNSVESSSLYLMNKIREADEEVSRLAKTLTPLNENNPLDVDWLGDIRDHLHHIHMLLTSVKGHVGSVNHALKKIREKDKA